MHARGQALTLAHGSLPPDAAAPQAATTRRTTSVTLIPCSLSLPRISNLTFVIDDALLKDARIKALKDDSSVNEICRRSNEQYIGQGEDDAERHVARLRAGFVRALPRAGDASPAWQGRAALYGERMQELDKRRRTNEGVP